MMISPSNITEHKQDKHPMMRCGHAANGICNSKAGVKYSPGIPSCVICSCINIATQEFDLTNRKARCCSLESERDSSLDLAFFEYRGPGSKQSIESCANCGYYEVAHNKPKIKSCGAFKPHGAYGYDLYYCGCKGWD